MEVQIKKTVKVGNSSAVVLPKSWLHKEVRVELIEKTHEKILFEVLEILGTYMKIKDIIGVYLTGSYAREDENEKSDIDILVISNGLDKEMISEGIYNILIVSTDLLKWKLENDLLPIGPMIKEAKSLINEDYINSIVIAVTKKNIAWYVDSTQEKLSLIKNVFDNYKNREELVNNRIIYTLVLRIRTFYLIDTLKDKNLYNKKEFVRLINRISGSNKAYESYLSVKNNVWNKDSLVHLIEAERLYDYLVKEIEKFGKIKW